MAERKGTEWAPVKPQLMLGIESSCDDTSIAVLRGNVFLSQFTAAQHIHAKYGGVVPEFASRAHQRHIVPSCNAAIPEKRTSRGTLWHTNEEL